MLPTGKNAFLTLTTVGPQHIIRSWPLPSGEQRLVGSMAADGIGRMSISGTSLAYVKGRTVYLRSLEDWGTPPRVIVEQESDVVYVGLSPDAARVATSDGTREIRIWSTAVRASEPDRVLQSMATVVGAGFDAVGRWLYALTFERGYPAVDLFDLVAPRGSDPLVLQKGDTSNAGSMAFTPSGRWLATTHGIDVAFWPLGTPRPHVLRGQTATVSVVFTPDGSRLLAMGADGSLRTWPVAGSGDAACRAPDEPARSIHQFDGARPCGADPGTRWRRRDDSPRCVSLTEQCSGCTACQTEESSADQHSARVVVCWLPAWKRDLPKKR